MKITAADVADQTTFISQAKQQFAERLSEPVADSFYTLVAQYFHQFPLEELAGQTWDDLFGSLFGWWQLLQKHNLRKCRIKVFNPNLEEHGWLSPHTVVAVLQRDMPFLVDSVRIEMNRRNIAIHTIKSTILAIKRDNNHQMVDLLPGRGQCPEGYNKEVLLFLEINLHTDDNELQDIASSLVEVLNQVETVVAAYQPLAERTAETRENLNRASQVEAAEVRESQDFLQWMIDGYFTFTGYCEYDLQTAGEQRLLVENKARRMGIAAMSTAPAHNTMVLDDTYPGVVEFYSSARLINFAKASVRSRVHRSAHPDYVIVKRYNEQGEVCGESRFLGLYTAPVYNVSPTKIPIIRDKVQYVFETAGLDSNSYDGKNLKQILENFPRDELFQSTAQELYEVALKVAQINERYRIRLFMRSGPYRKFVRCLLYVPRDIFNTQVRLKVQNIIGDAIGSVEEEFTTYFSESILARVHLVFKLAPDSPLDFDVKALEQQVIDVIRSWDDQLADALIEAFGEEKGAHYLNQFQGGFPSSYREHYDARTAVYDIQSIEELHSTDDVAMSFYQPVGSSERAVRFKIFRLEKGLELSEVIPLLENLGMRVIGEHPYRLQRHSTQGVQTIWLHNFSLEYDLPVAIDAGAMRQNFQDAFAAVWHGVADSDEFNRLVLGARLNWREVVLLRSYAAYMKQTLFNLSQSFIAHTLAHHLSITRNLVALFKANFDPRLNQGRDKDQERIERLRGKIMKGLDKVTNLTEDRVIRRYFALINGTLRTNFFQKDGAGQFKPYVSFKLSPRTISDIPEPRPLYEIFVYSSRVEGVHLRGSAVARGGLRWSDRLEDYRTEVLGLVKAQHVKNAVIVPGGAKGGFVAKNIASDASRDEFFAEGIACYRLFISGLLDITDNLVNNATMPPDNVVRHDPDDPYLVVAADKGTATFSDIANEISLQYNHWLGDAFASGGSQGYDHKKMGITARGAWVSVQRHFREMGVNIQEEDFTVVGIGDMAGDVFGNGMLLSEHICLQAAFNHQAIFIDPAPDPAKSFAERQRLFNLPKSSWYDYDEALISQGGGIFSRDLKSITITPEMRECFAIEETSLTPTELINCLLKAPVDLIWNGGIGTYVKAASESHARVGDKANDSLRVNGRELRCKVFGEGGNLGTTQLGRVEYALNGGAINTDFIDNSAGVDCSDHEVNIKILLNELVTNGDLTEKQRNQLLVDMTDSVAELVLDNNYQQTQAISVAQRQSLSRMGEFRRFINALESEGKLKRSLEFIPEEEALVERQTNKQPLTRPELAVLVSYSKVGLKEALVDPAVADDPYVGGCLEEPFPPLLREKFTDAIYQHRLRREIIATQLANNMVNAMGFTFCQRMSESTGVGVVAVAKAYVTARDIYGQEAFREQVEKLDYQISAQLQYDLLIHIARRVRRATRWLLRNRRSNLDVTTEVAQFKPVIEQIVRVLPTVLQGPARQAWDQEYDRLVDLGLPSQLAAHVAMPANLYSGLGMVEAARQSGATAEQAAQAYALLGDYLHLHWFADAIDQLPVESYWQAMAREAYMDDLESQIRRLAVSLICLAGSGQPLTEAVEQWAQTQSELVERWRAMVAELQAAPGTDFAMFSVALRELLDLAQASQYCLDQPDN